MIKPTQYIGHGGGNISNHLVCIQLHIVTSTKQNIVIGLGSMDPKYAGILRESDEYLQLHHATIMTCFYIVMCTDADCYHQSHNIGGQRVLHPSNRSTVLYFMLLWKKKPQVTLRTDQGGNLFKKQVYPDFCGTYPVFCRI